MMSESLIARQRSDDVGVTRISDREAAHAVVAPARRAKLVVVSAEVVHASLGKHGIVLDLALAQSWAIVRDQNQLGLTLPQRLQCCLGSQAVLAALHNQGETSIDAVESLRLLGSLLVRHGAVSGGKGQVAANRTNVLRLSQIGL